MTRPTPYQNSDWPEAHPASAAHGSRSEPDARPVTSVFSVRNECKARASQGYPHSPGGSPKQHDRWDQAASPVGLMIFAAAVCLLTLLIASTVYPAFFHWMTRGSL